MIFLSASSLKTLTRMLTVGDRSGKVFTKPPLKIEFKKDHLKISNGKLNRTGIGGEGEIPLKDCEVTKPFDIYVNSVMLVNILNQIKGDRLKVYLYVDKRNTRHLAIEPLDVPEGITVWHCLPEMYGQIF